MHSLQSCKLSTINIRLSISMSFRRIWQSYGKGDDMMRGFTEQ